MRYLWSIDLHSLWTRVGEDFKIEYINFHANLFKIYKKTKYNRKYHLSHTLDQIILKNKVEISCSTNFNKIFVEINKILPQIHGRRKRIINLKYLLHRILQLIKIDSSQIELTKSKKTMKLYNVYWNNIMDIIILSKLVCQIISIKMSISHYFFYFI